MATPALKILDDMPAFLMPQEPRAEFAYWSDGRFLVKKGEQEIALTMDDLRAMRRYFDKFAAEVLS